MIRWPISYPFALIVALLAILPVAVLFVLASDSVEFFDAHNLKVLYNTLLLMILTVVGSVIIGVPLAFLTTYIQLPFRRFWVVLYVAPLAMPSYLGAFTFYAAFGPGGEIKNLLGFDTPSIDGLVGAALIMSLYTYPFVMLTTRAALSSLDASQVYAARTLGLSLWKSLWRVVLPRITNGIAAGALLAAMYALSDFGTPAIMGLDTFTRVIYVEYNSFGLAQAAMLSIQLLLVVGLVLFLESRIKGTQEKPSQQLLFYPQPIQLSAMLASTAPVIVLSIILPLAIFFLWLWRDGAGEFDLSIAWNSAHASILAAMVAVVLALPLAFAAIAGKLGRLFERVAFIGFGVPGIVMGTALVYVGLQLPFLYQTLGLLVLAYVLRFIPLAVSSIRAKTESLDGSLVNAARVLGAGRYEALRRITLPLSMRGIIAGAALVFLESMRELPATLLLGPTGFETLATYLWRVYEAGYFGRAAIPGLLLIVISAAALAIMLSGEAGDKTKLTKGPSK